MSSQQAALVDFDAEPEVQTVAEHERTLDGRGAVYAGRGVEPDVDDGGVTCECLNCANDVPREIARINGDNCTDGVTQWFVAIQRGRGHGYEKRRVSE